MIDTIEPTVDQLLERVQWLAPTLRDCSAEADQSRRLPDAAVRAMTRTGRTFEPDRANAVRYDALYARVYRKLYARLEPLYAELQAVVGR